MAHTPPRSRAIAWLTDAGPDVPAEIRARLIADYFAQFGSTVLGVFSSLSIGLLAVARTPEPWFQVICVCDVALLILRSVLFLRSRRAASRGERTPTDAFFATGLAWTALVGVTVGLGFLTGDPVLQVTGPVIAMGITSGITTRNSSSPRFALAQIALCQGPFALALCASGNSWFLILALQFVVLMVMMRNTVCRLHQNYLTLLLTERDADTRATHDELTGLWNRPGLMMSLTRQLADQANGSRRLSLLFLDLDGFKAINDAHGHAAGDRLLRDFAARLRACLPASSLIARFGGDEFVVVLADCLPREAEEMARMLIGVAAAPFDVGHAPLVTIGLSIGIARAETRCRPEDLLAAADAALYRAKASGKGRFEVAGGLPRAA